MARWLCTVCNYVHEGPEPPARCPICDAPADVFVREPEGPAPAALAPKGLQAPSDAPPKNLEEVRDRARVRLAGLCGVYPACDGAPERLCQRESYGRSIGFGGAGSGAAFAANVASLARLRLRTRLVGEHFEPDTTFRFLGLTLSSPVLGASTSGVGKYKDDIDERQFCRDLVRGCREAGSLSWRGDTFFYTPEDHPALDILEAEGGYGVPIFKPRAQDALKRLIERAEKAGCPAVGVDLDGCGSTNMARAGQPVFRKSVREIRDLVQSTRLPFIAKGILCVEDAEACVEAGVQVVSVSNHGGRVLDATPGVAEVLPAIAEKIRRHVLVTADGGVRTGYDVLKLLALGAHAVLVGRDLIRAALGGGAVGVRLQTDHLRQVLGRAMVMTACPTLAAIDSHVLA